ncbi:MAG: lysophospholipid acyltransferase family protein [Desulfobacterales bacterium]|jgi:1-acyl-sn-glycerol-3-phosphate acyltransferase
MAGINRSDRLPFAGALRDLAVTVLLWSYFTVGFVILFSPFYLLALVLGKHRERAFQRLNCRFYRGFFFLLRRLIPACRWRIDPAAAAVRGSVVVSNHVSYLDPILLISLFPRHRTIVKNRLFQIPLFGRMLALSGYLPAAAGGRFGHLTIEGIASMPDFLAAGGNLFVFPEGTRSRNSRIGRFNPGAFKVARNCKAPIVVLRIRNSDRLFTPGRFSFNAGRPNTIFLDVVDRIAPDDPRYTLPLAELTDEVRKQGFAREMAALPAAQPPL